VTLERIEREKSRLADDVYERLMAAILDGRISPGDRLIQDKLAEDLMVSRTPVREALLRLEKEGTVELAPVRGYVVTSPTRDELTQIYQAREAVEVYAARLVAEAGPGALEHVTAAIASADPPHASIVESFNANRRLHRSIVEASGNRVLRDLFDAVWNRSSALRLFAELCVQEHPVSQTVAAMHDEVLQALASGDPDVAAKAMTVHIRQGRASHPQV
jgi:DNA-binding GntR family transcriptional regulator